jgi:hypothetical protein
VAETFSFGDNAGQQAQKVISDNIVLTDQREGIQITVQDDLILIDGAAKEFQLAVQDAITLTDAQTKHCDSTAG